MFLSPTAGDSSALRPSDSWQLRTCSWCPWILPSPGAPWVFQKGPRFKSTWTKETRELAWSFKVKEEGPWSQERAVESLSIISSKFEYDQVLLFSNAAVGSCLPQWVEERVKRAGRRRQHPAPARCWEAPQTGRALLLQPPAPRWAHHWWVIWQNGVTVPMSQENYESFMPDHAKAPLWSLNTAGHNSA